MAVNSAKTVRIPRRRALVVVMWLCLAGLGASTGPFTGAATALVLIPSGVLLILALRRPTADIVPTPRLRRGVRVWSALLVALVMWETFAYLRQPDRLHSNREHPTLSTLLDPGLQDGPLRFAGWLAWLWVGWWLVRR
ncbi:hypothetical protein [Nocardia transvalensis]|uniref:hypothetical protein n=1 Tax=Nocardia transvalensis TaxID=37333 RepID=UPI001893217A|nr:hypothetical protein [Nocardia transvalensis]MBF6327848.1 hypothetical protein [Nocardia transvalensis]